MSTIDQRATLLPGAAIVVGIRQLLVWGVVAAALLATLLRGTAGGCSGGIAGTGGGFIGPSGERTDVEPMCGQLTMTTHPLMFLLLAAIVLGALTRVLRRADDVDDALRILANARLVIALATMAAFAIGYLTFFTVDTTDWASPGVLIPIPVVGIDIETWPITQR